MAGPFQEVQRGIGQVAGLPSGRYTSAIACVSLALIIEHRRLRSRCAELDTRMRDFVVTLLDHKLSGDAVTNRNGIKRKERDR